MPVAVLLLVFTIIQLGNAQIYLPCYRDDHALPQGCTCLNDHAPIVSCQSLGLTAVPNVTRAYSLNLGNNSISSLPANAFAHISGLKKIYLHTNKMKLVNANAFTNVDLEHLDLSDNRLRAVPRMLGNREGGFSNLRFLKLSKNYISVIDDEAFKGLPRLRHLYLDGNYVNLIQPDAWLGPRRLKHLELSADNVDIMRIPTQNLQHITSLSVTGAKPKRLDLMQSWFESMPQILHLKLIEMGLTDTHLMNGHFPDAWKMKLQSLSLQGNDLTKIPYNVLKFPVLQELDLSRNMIKVISRRSNYYSLPLHVLKFNISSNMLNIVNTGHILSLTNAREIDLSDNQFRGLDWTVADIDKYLMSGVIFYLGDNPWICRCSDNWLKKLANRQVQHNNEHMTDYEINHTFRCGPGGSNSGKLISEVPNRDFCM